MGLDLEMLGELMLIFPMIASHFQKRDNDQQNHHENHWV